MSVWINKCREADKITHPRLNVKLDLPSFGHSGIYQGIMTLHHLKPYKNNIKHKVGLLAIDLNELDKLEYGHLFSAHRWAFIRFNPADYIHVDKSIDSVDKNLNPHVYFGQEKDMPLFDLKRRVLNKIKQILKNKSTSNEEVYARSFDRIVFVGQVRQFGCYFSPVNLFYCYDQNKPQYLLVEVNKTISKKRHYFAIDLQKNRNPEQDRHALPFIDVDMSHKWYVSPLEDKASIGVESYKMNQLFNAWLNLERSEFNSMTLKRMINQFPLIGLQLFFTCHWQHVKCSFKKLLIGLHKPKKKARFNQ